MLLPPSLFFRGVAGRNNECSSRQVRLSVDLREGTMNAPPAKSVFSAELREGTMNAPPATAELREGAMNAPPAKSVFPRSCGKEQ